MSSFRRRSETGDLLIWLSVSLSITLGVNLKVGDSLYTSNTAYKLIGLLVPISFVFLAILLSSPEKRFELSKLKIIWIVLFLSYSLYLGVTSRDLGRFLIGTADRNLGGISVALGVLFFIVGRFLNKKQQQIILVVVLLNSLLQALIVGYQKFLQPDVPSLSQIGVFYSPPVVGTLYNANPLSFFLGIAASGLLGILIKSRLQKRELILGLLALTVLFLGIIWSSSSQGLIGLCVTGVAFAAGKLIPPIRQKFSQFLAWLYGIALVCFLFAVSAISLSPSLDVSQNPYLERLEIYKSALKIASANLFLGTGIDQFASEYGKFTLLRDLKLVDNAHSIPLQMISTLGLLGFFFYLSFVFWVLRSNRFESLPSDVNWSFWQAAFFSFVVIGIIGIEHPVITSIGFLAAGVLSANSQMLVSEPKKVYSKLKWKFTYSGLLVFSFFLSLSLNFLVNSELKVGNALSQLSQNKISAQKFESIVEVEYEKVYNARVLLILGEAYTAIGNRGGATNVANLMQSRFPDDQRTSALFFLIAKTWNDTKAYENAIELRDQLFPNSKGI